MYQNISHEVVLWRIDVATKDMKKSMKKMKSLRSDIQQDHERVPRIWAQSMLARRLTVQTHFNYRVPPNDHSDFHHHALPHIRILGQWVRKAGFEIGDKVLVTLENGKLVISKVELEAAAGSSEVRRTA